MQLAHNVPRTLALYAHPRTHLRGGVVVMRGLGAGLRNIHCM